jgi:hypothetical protein
MAKIAVALFKVSTSMRSLWHSRRSRASSCWSALVSPPPLRGLAMPRSQRRLGGGIVWRAARCGSSLVIHTLGGRNQLSRSGPLSCSASVSSRTVSVRGDRTRSASRLRTVRSPSSAMLPAAPVTGRPDAGRLAGGGEALTCCSISSPRWPSTMGVIVISPWGRLDADHGPAKASVRQLGVGRANHRRPARSTHCGCWPPSAPRGHLSRERRGERPALTTLARPGVGRPGRSQAEDRQIPPAWTLLPPVSAPETSAAPVPYRPRRLRPKYSSRA